MIFGGWGGVGLWVGDSLLTGKIKSGPLNSIDLLISTLGNLQ